MKQSETCEKYWTPDVESTADAGCILFASKERNVTQFALQQRFVTASGLMRHRSPSMTQIDRGKGSFPRTGQVNSISVQCRDVSGIARIKDTFLVSSTMRSDAIG